MEGKPGALEFFAGGGMAACGLRHNWRIQFANEISPRKAASYRANFPEHRLSVADVASLDESDLPSGAELAWSSFPCQDLSLAGRGRGLHAERSGTFWSFWRLIEKMREQGAALGLIVIENVLGLASARGGGDFRMLLQTIVDCGYRVGALAIDAAHFCAQSRPRLFVIAVDQQRIADADLSPLRLPSNEAQIWDAPALRRFRETISGALAEAWVDWRLPLPETPPPRLADVLDTENVSWAEPAATAGLLSQMSATQKARLQTALQTGEFVGSVFRRTRRSADGEAVVRAECRFDGLAGCLRTPAGGSSRQSLLVVRDGMIGSRLLSPRETARLMGLPESYLLPERDNEAYHLTGDGVVVPVVEHLDRHLLTPLVRLLSARDPVQTSGERAVAGRRGA